MADSGIRTRSLWFPQCGDVHHICFIHDTNASAETKSACHEENQEKEKNSDYWIAYFPLEKISKENNKWPIKKQRSCFKFGALKIADIGKHVKLIQKNLASLHSQAKLWNLIQKSK